MSADIEFILLHHSASGLRYLNPNTDSVEFMPDSKDLIVEP